MEQIRRKSKEKRKESKQGKIIKERPKEMKVIRIFTFNFLINRFTNIFFYQFSYKPRRTIDEIKTVDRKKNSYEAIDKKIGCKKV